MSNRLNSLTFYDFEVMKCVNPDNLTFAERLSDNAWTFYQITSLSLLKLFEGTPEQLIEAYNSNSTVNDVEVFAELNKSHSVVSFTVDLRRENADTIDTYKNRFADTVPDDWKYLACEDIFIQESSDSIAENILKQDKHYYE